MFKVFNMAHMVTMYRRRHHHTYLNYKKKDDVNCCAHGPGDAENQFVSHKGPLRQESLFEKFHLASGLKMIFVSNSSFIE
jgi:hypothetical protein